MLNIIRDILVIHTGRGGCKTTLRIIGAWCFLIGSMNALAVGLGDAGVNSYIGERLSVSIPVVSVNNPAKVKVRVRSSSLHSQLQVFPIIHPGRVNAQVSIVVSTESIVNEPYLNFILEVTDATSSASREFTVLLAPASKGQREDTSSTPDSISGIARQGEILGKKRYYASLSEAATTR